LAVIGGAPSSFKTPLVFNTASLHTLVIWRYVVKEDCWKESNSIIDKCSCAAVAFHGQTKRIILTGGVQNGQVVKDAMYTEDFGSTFHSLPDMPEGRFYQRMVVLDGGNIFVVGGTKERPVWNNWTNSCFMYLSEKNGWIRCPDMRNKTHDFYCGFVTKVDGEEEIVVFGGGNHGNSVEIFSISEMCWRSGV
jgi:N-acetylneuraminic acid mutarotase